MGSPVVTVTRKGAIAVVTIDSPPVNAMTIAAPAGYRRFPGEAPCHQRRLFTRGAFRRAGRDGIA
jgi:hypothetical protein